MRADILLTHLEIHSYRYQLVDNKLIAPLKLLLSLPATPGPKDTGGVLKIGPDDNLYLTVGHLDGSFRDSKYETKTQNYPNSSKVDGRAGILVTSQDGKPVGKGIWEALSHSICITHTVYEIALV